MKRALLVAMFAYVLLFPSVGQPDICGGVSANKTLTIAHESVTLQCFKDGAWEIIAHN